MSRKLNITLKQVKRIILECTSKRAVLFKIEEQSLINDCLKEDPGSFEYFEEPSKFGYSEEQIEDLAKLANLTAGRVRDLLESPKNNEKIAEIMRDFVAKHDEIKDRKVFFKY